MELPVSPPLAPMLAKAVKELPRGDVLYEPKWDGFRAVVFRDRDEVAVHGRNGKPLDRYFPELVEGFGRELPERCVIDGEIVLRKGHVLDFDALQQRIHPAASRIKLLAAETPASFVAFDLLALGDESLMETPFGDRRARLTEALAGAKAPVHVTPATDAYDVALRWFEEFEGAGLDGVVVKPLAGPYEPDRRAMFKVKHDRTADCVVAGFRWHKSGPIVGSLLLGLYDGDRLQHVGVAASFPMTRRKELVEELEPYRVADLTGHPWAGWAEQTEATVDRMPGAISRWTGKKDLSWVALRPELVCEVAYDQMEGRRFRHTARFRRWRTDRTPESCGYDQLEVPVAYDLDDILGG
ncbi:ATP-dependent DNA ligase [Actinoallomurus purpureus]|uniref:ATP-dependent DNA ligase n=1 Tax=Actinoallomurus purpureus TaxID=478114 RepID=UPI00209381E3|nr:ATP-dependent DNA ligase [Actinoallomurus purpureus]MCO6009654.1 ATP-dependent DNA ligase [Actinoallomurus purpureus]